MPTRSERKEQLNIDVGKDHTLQLIDQRSFQRYVERGPAVVEAFLVESEDPKAQATLTSVHGDTIKVHVGEWVVIDPGGSLSVMTDDEFNAAYVLAPEDVEPTDPEPEPDPVEEPTHTFVVGDPVRMPDTFKADGTVDKYRFGTVDAVTDTSIDVAWADGTTETIEDPHQAGVEVDPNKAK